MRRNLDRNLDPFDLGRVAARRVMAVRLISYYFPNVFTVALNSGDLTELSTYKMFALLRNNIFMPGRKFFRLAKSNIENDLQNL
jgi:hypothetical protein